MVEIRLTPAATIATADAADAMIVTAADPTTVKAAKRMLEETLEAIKSATSAMTIVIVAATAAATTMVVVAPATAKEVSAASEPTKIEAMTAMSAVATAELRRYKDDISRDSDYKKDICSQPPLLIHLCTFSIVSK